jgi:hypothetical protein
MATTMTFNGVLETGMSFLRVTAVILLVSGMIGGLGLSLIDSGDTGIGTLLLLISGLILIAGVIGLMQKLISDAFLEGFKAAKEDGRVGDGTKMNVNQTLASGFQVIGVVLLTAIVSGILFGIGLDMIDPFSRGSTVFGSLMLASGCAVSLAMIMGMLARVIAEGVSFGASSTSVSFDSGPAKGATHPSSGSESDPLSFMADWSDHYKRLVFSTVALVIGLCLPWWGDRDWGFSGLDMLLSLGKQPDLPGWHLTYYTLTENFEWLNVWGGGILAIQGAIFWLLPWLFAATFAYAWIGHFQDNEIAAQKAGRFHFTIFVIYLLSVIIAAFTQTVGCWGCYEEDKLAYILIDRYAIYIAGFAGLGLVPEVTSRLSSTKSSGTSHASGTDATFEELDTDGDGVLSKQEVEASEEIPDGSFEDMDADGDGSVSEDEFDEFDFDFDEDDDEVPSLEDMTKEELKTLCKERGLSASGNKTDILARLLSEDE